MNTLSISLGLATFVPPPAGTTIKHILTDLPFDRAKRCCKGDVTKEQMLREESARKERLVMDTLTDLRTTAQVSLGCGLSIGSASNILGQLVKKGLVVKMKFPKDKRMYWSLT
jgi:hypothetical protein